MYKLNPATTIVKLLAIAFVFNLSSNLFGNERVTSDDDIPFVSELALIDANITFCVDLSCLPSATAPSVFGSFNGWNAGANFLTNMGGGLWCTTVCMPAGMQEYKFFVQEGEESFCPGIDGDISNGCTITCCGGAFTNRFINVVAGVNQTVTFGYNSCTTTCQPSSGTPITFCLDLSCAAAPMVPPSIFGTFNGWNPAANPLSDPDGDGIWCTTIDFCPGAHEWKFFLDGGDEQFMPGGSCTTTNFGFTNRLINVVAGVPQTVTFGFNSCMTSCVAPPASAPITLCVDLSCLPSATAPSVFGTFNGWCANCNPLTDTGNGIWCTTVVLPGGMQEFKFFIQEGEEQFAGGESCTLTTGGFTNRVVNVTGTPQTLLFGFNSCNATCVPPAGADIEFCLDLCCPDPGTAVNIFGTFNGWNANANPLTDPDGDGVYCGTIFFPPGQHEFKFLVNGVEETFAPGIDGDLSNGCTITCCGGQFTNRFIQVMNGVPQTVTFGFESCMAPMISAVCQDVTIVVDATGVATVDPAILDGGSDDGCGNTPTLTANVSEYTCDQLLACETIFAVRLTASTPCKDDVASCFSNVTVINTTGPSMFCNNRTVILDGGGNGFTSVTGLASGSPCVPAGDFATGAVSFSVDRALNFTCTDLVPDPSGCATPIAVTVTGTDECGNTSQCVANITLVDELAPIIACPNDKIISLPSGLCATFATERTPTVLDNCGATIVNNNVDPGLITVVCDPLCEGPALVTVPFSFSAQDACGNMAPDCNYTVTYVEFQSESLFFACNDHVNISLNAACEVDPMILAGAVLEGDQFGCLSCYDIGIENIHTETTFAQYNVTVTDPCTQRTCWGSVTVEDKTDPTIVCSDCIDPDVTNPDCILNCTELELFTTLDRETGVLGYDEGLLDDLIPSDGGDFIDDSIIEACGAPMTASYSDVFTTGTCHEGTFLTRTWTVLFTRPDGSVGSLGCERFYRFLPISPVLVTDAEGNVTGLEAPHDTLAPGVFVPIVDETTEDVILMPKAVVEIPLCSVGTSPAEIAAFFDNPATVDRDTDDDNIDPDEFDIDCVIESNEGCLLYTSPSPRDGLLSRMPSSA